MQPAAREIFPGPTVTFVRERSIYISRTATAEFAFENNRARSRRAAPGRGRAARPEPLCRLVRGELRPRLRFRRPACPRREEAEDVTAEVFHQALAGLAGFEWQGTPFVAWLLGIASHLVARRWQLPVAPKPCWTNWKWRRLPTRPNGRRCSRSCWNGCPRISAM